jgi:cell wall-associated NlpC family hydrolase
VAPGRSYRPARTLLTVCTAAVTAVVVLPSTSQAEPKLGLADVKRQVADLHHKAEIASEQFNDAQGKLRKLEQRLAQYQATVQRQQAKVTALQETMGVVAAAQYRAGGMDSTLQLLFSDNPEQFLQQASSLSQLTDRQADALRQIAEQRQELTQDKLGASQQLAELEQTRNELAKDKAEVEKNLQKAQRLLNSLSAGERRRLQESDRASRDHARSEIPKGGYTGPASGRARAAVDFAYAQVGDGYVWGATGMSVWDCSGLTMKAWQQAGVSLPHSSSQQYSSGHHVSKGDLQAGDLVFFYKPISHVGLYIGNGKMIHAANPSKGVLISPISEMPYAGAVRP